MGNVVQAIFLNHIPYTGSNSIIKVYSNNHGALGLMARGIKSARSKSKGLYQPLTILELEFNFNPNKSLQTLGKANLIYAPSAAHTDYVRMTFCWFIAEVIQKSVQEEETNPLLFGFLTNQIKALNETKIDANFHLKFLLELSIFLGFYPRKRDLKSNVYFNLLEGVFENPQALNSNHLSEQSSYHLAEYLETGEFSRLSRMERTHLLKGIVAYFEIQLGLPRKSFKSLDILIECMN